MEGKKSASTVVRQCLDVRPGESVLVVTDEKRRSIGKKIYEESRKVSDKTIYVEINETGEHGAEPPIPVSKAMKNSDVIIAPTTYSLSHTRARKEACQNGSRVATMPGITEKMFLTTLRADYADIKNRCNLLFEMIKDTSTIAVKTPSGTDLKLEVNAEFWHTDTGVIKNKGDFGNLPAGEVDGSPVNANGKVVIDFLKSGDETIAPPGTEVEIKENKAVSIYKECKLSRAFKEIKNAENVAELGIGTNPEAELVGNILQDEKVLGTCHVAFGDSTSYGKDISSEIHWDAILEKPSIWFDDKKIMEKGVLKVET